jgi:hypothetical protein
VRRYRLRRYQPAGCVPPIDNPSICIRGFRLQAEESTPVICAGFVHNYQPAGSTNGHIPNEVMTMRKSLAAVLFAGGLVLGYAARTVPVSAQLRNGEFLPFNNGETVRLKVDLPESLRLCVVTQVLNGFIGCAADRTAPPRWINLRNVQEITPAPER